jgi:hypothetical protein
MLTHARRAAQTHQQPTFDMRSLRRLAFWGGSATVALILAIVAGFSEPGSKRASANVLGTHGKKADAQLAPRPLEPDAETRRLAEIVHVLAADREQLVSRLGTIERNLEDITGAIKRQGAVAAATSLAQPTAPAAKEAALESRVAASPIRQPAGGAEGQPLSLERPVVSPEPPEDASAEKAEIGVDVGGAANFGGLRVLWASTKSNHGALFDGLYPIVAVRENNRTTNAELRLLVGPLANVEVAARLCASLSSARRYCQPVAFEGQRLADTDSLVERRPPAAPKPNAAPRPVQNQAAPKLPRLFQ